MTLGISETKNNIESLTDDLSRIRKSLEFKLSVLDKSINSIQSYHKSSDSKNIDKFSYDQIDLVDRIYENVIAIWYSLQG